MPGRGTLDKEKPPIFGRVERGGALVLQRLAKVRQATIQPLIRATIAPSSLLNTDEYDIYARLSQWGYDHKTVCHGRGEYARDDDGDGLCEVHVNTLEGIWSLLRSWLRSLAAFPKRNSRSIAPSSRSFTMPRFVAKRSSPPSSPPF